MYVCLLIWFVYLYAQVSRAPSALPILPPQLLGYCSCGTGAAPSYQSQSQSQSQSIKSNQIKSNQIKSIKSIKIENQLIKNLGNIYKFFSFGTRLSFVSHTAGKGKKKKKSLYCLYVGTGYVCMYVCMYVCRVSPFLCVSVYPDNMSFFCRVLIIIIITIIKSRGNRVCGATRLFSILTRPRLLYSNMYHARMLLYSK